VSLDLADDRRDVLQAGALGGAPTALSRDDLVLIVHGRAHQNWLQYAHFSNRRGERRQCLFVEVLSRLKSIGYHRGHW
jgi:hypothetical protein